MSYVTWNDLFVVLSFVLDFVGVLFGVLAYFKNNKKSPPADQSNGYSLFELICCKGSGRHESDRAHPLYFHYTTDLRVCQVFLFSLIQSANSPPIRTKRELS